MTKLELQVWVSAFASNQPRDGNYPAWDGGTKDGLRSATYWAGCAVFALRGIGHPSDDECKDLLEAARRANLNSVEQP